MVLQVGFVFISERTWSDNEPNSLFSKVANILRAGFPCLNLRECKFDPELIVKAHCPLPGKPFGTSGNEMIPELDTTMVFATDIVEGFSIGSETAELRRQFYSSEPSVVL